MESLSRQLCSLYGPAPGRRAARKIRNLIDRWAAPLAEVAARRSGASLTERDVLLIAYADQVREPGQAPLRTLANFCEKRLRDIVSGIHVLPFYPWSSDDGFAVKDYYKVDPAVGDWEDVASLARSFDLMFDAVFNHMSARGDWFQRFQRDEPEFRDFFVTVDGHPDLSQVVRPRALPLLTEFPTASGRRRVWTTFSADQVDLNFKNPAVLLAVVDALLFYVAKGARFIRLDAVAFLWKEIGTPCLHLPQTHRIVRLLRAVLDRVAPHVLLVTETNVAHADNISYFGDGTNEAQLVYNFALPPLVLHAIASSNASALTRWAETLRTPSSNTAFLNFLASHDGIGLNPVRGILPDKAIEAIVERVRRHGGLISMKENQDGTRSPYELNTTWFDALNDPNATESREMQIDRFNVSQAIMLALGGVPAVYFNSLLDSRNDRTAAEATGIARRINRQKHDRAQLDRRLDDHQTRSARLFSRYRCLLRARRGCSAFHPQGYQRVLNSDERVFALLRASPDGRRQALCLHNVSDAPVSVPFAAVPREARRDWASLLDESSSCSSGRGIRLGPYQVLWLGHRA